MFDQRVLSPARALSLSASRLCAISLAAADNHAPQLQWESESDTGFYFISVKCWCWCCHPKQLHTTERTIVPQTVIFNSDRSSRRYDAPLFQFSRIQYFVTNSVVSKRLSQRWDKKSCSEFPPGYWVPPQQLVRTTQSGKVLHSRRRSSPLSPTLALPPQSRLAPPGALGLGLASALLHTCTRSRSSQLMYL